MVFRATLQVAVGCIRTFTVCTSEFHTSICLLKGNVRRLPVASAVAGGASARANSRRENVAQMRAAASRAKWEAEVATATRLRDHCIPENTTVYFASSFERKPWPLSEAVNMLREAAVPEIYDCVDNPISAKITLNMRTKKTTKFVSKYELTVRLPHRLEFLPKRRIIALCNSPAQVDECLALGALSAGGADVVSRLETGAFHWEEYDELVAHTDFADSLRRLRKVLRNRVPTERNGRLGVNVPIMVEEQQVSVLLNSVPLEGVPEIAHVNVVLGQLSWDTQRLFENLVAYIQVLNDNKSSRLNGPLLEEVRVECLPCDERIAVDLGPLLAEVKSANPEKNKCTAAKNDPDLESENSAESS